MIGSTVRHYKILEKLGEGGMGIVYKAHDTKLNRTVALKFLPDRVNKDQEAKSRFLQEAQAAAGLNHPNICTVHGIEDADGSLFMVMEYVEGGTLRDKLPYARAEDAIAAAIQIGEALHEAHNKGIVHRDIKADNIMLTAKGQPKVMDFGLAKLKGALKLTRTSSTVGTLGYMAPEQIQGGDVDHRSDIFSFGVLFFEMLTGKLPFRGEHEAAMMYSILNEEPEQLLKYRIDASEELQRIIGRAFEKDPEDRYQSAADMVSELRRLQKKTGRISKTIPSAVVSLPVPAAPSVEGSPRPRFSRRTLTIVASVALLLVGMVLSYLLFRGPSGGEKKSIAVIPFVNLNDNKANEYFADGMTEDIIIQLSKIRELKVISRTSVMQYKNSGKTSKEIGAELNVATVLEGTVRREGNEIRVDAQLIDTKNDQNIWAETYDKQAAQVFAIQRDVAQQIAVALKATLSPEEKEQIEKKTTSNITAYDFYLKGREYYYRYRKDDNDRAVDLFKEALEADPRYALAYAGLGDCYGQRTIKFGYSEQWLDSSIAVCEQALHIDPTLAEAHKAIALAYSGKGWNKQSLEENLKSVQYNPNNNPAISNVAFNYISDGNYPAALEWTRKSIATSPSLAFDYFCEGLIYTLLDDDAHAKVSYSKTSNIQPDFIYAFYGRSVTYLAEGDCEKATEEARKILAMDPNELTGLLCLGNAYLFEGNLPFAREQFEKAFKINPQAELEYFGGQSATALGYIYLHSSRKTEGRAMLQLSLANDQRQLQLKNETFTVTYDLACIYAIEGKKAEMSHWLSKSFNAGWRFHRIAERSPYFEKFRDDPDFQKIILKTKYSVDAMRNQIGE